MGYSVHVPLGFGHLKFKSGADCGSARGTPRSRVWRIGSMYVVWQPRSKDAGSDRDDPIGKKPTRERP